jgi:DNA invertase Pin-like site-specific DNA recombinase
MIYGYVRVSTNAQMVENQRFEIECFCRQNHYHIDRWIAESISGTKDYKKRGLGKVLRGVKKGDIIICTELSRLGRSLFMIMDILNLCMKKGTKLWALKENYRLGDDIESKVLAFAFGISAEIERNLISQRTKECLARLKAEGKTLGRPKGAKNKKSKLTGHEEFILKMLQKGESLSSIAKTLKIHPNTMTKYFRKLSTK